jgi:DNA-binding NtrC family response regulator
MSSNHLLWIDKEADSHFAGFEEVLAEFRVTRVDGLTDSPLSNRPGPDCALVTGPFPTDAAIDILEQLQAMDAALPVIFWNPGMSAADAVRLVRAGAHDCMGHGDTLDMLRDSLGRAAAERRRRGATRERAAVSDEPWRASLVGESEAIESVAEIVRLVGSRRCTVLITGETGSGKEVVARALHAASPRARYQMVAINCSAVPEHLLEAELFGHVKGAFTGAIQARTGRFEQAHKSTLFLDEIGDMPIELQAKLLRVLQERVVYRLGSCEGIPVDVRVIAASNVDLHERMRQGRFREDLYYRLNVVPIKVPSLRERESDIPLLVDHFVRKICREEQIAPKTVSPEAMARLRAGSWPGNIRQLENAIEMAVIMSGDRALLHASDFGLPPCPSKVIPFETGASFPLPDSLDFAAAVNSFERAMLEQALRKTAGNKTAAAELLGLKRTTLVMKLRQPRSPAPLRGNVARRRQRPSDHLPRTGRPDPLHVPA